MKPARGKKCGVTSVEKVSSNPAALGSTRDVPVAAICSVGGGGGDGSDEDDNEKDAADDGDGDGDGDDGGATDEEDRVGASEGIV